MNPPLSPERARQIHALFDEVVDLGPEERLSRLDQVEDPSLRREVESLLYAYMRADEVLYRLEHGAEAGAPVETDPCPLTGQNVLHYQVLEELGGGGMGLVYKARDTKLGRLVVLKFLPRHLSSDPEARVRLMAEARATSALDHPNLAIVHEVGEHQGQLFIAMAFYEGETLKQKIQRGPLPVEEALGYAAQIAEGLRQAHEAGLVHRDVKPANVILTRRGQVKIIDFGLAKVLGADLTTAGAALGTVAYMSPEQTRGEALDHRTDLWSLGVVLYEMLTGERPFRGESDQALIYAIRHDAPEPVDRLRPEVPAGLAALVGRSLEKSPSQRYQQAEALLADLQTLQAGGTPRRHPVWRKRVPLYGIVAALLVLLALVGRTLLMPAGARIESLAVLPVTDFAGDAEQKYFADGMTDLLINQISQLSGLDRVISRTSVMQYKDTQKSLREIGRELGVHALVEASVLREGERVRINVSLVEAETERNLWSGSFERPIRNVLTLQREVAQAIAREIEVQLTPQEAMRLAEAAPEVNPEAFALYLQGLRVNNDLPQSTAYLEQAVAKDASFARAHVALGRAYTMAGERSRAEQALDRALALDPSLSDAYDALGLLRMWIDWDWAAAEAALRRAIALKPHNSVAHHELGQLRMRLGRCDEAIAEEQRAVSLDPGSAHHQSGLAEVYLYCRRYDEAFHEFEKTFDLVRDSSNVYWNLGETYFHQGQHEKALRMYEKTPWPPGWVYAALGRQQEALQQISTLKAAWAQGAEDGFVTWSLARIYTSLGEREEAIAWLERAYAERKGLLVYLGVHPHFDALRGEPRFQALLKKMGLDG